MKKILFVLILAALAPACTDNSLPEIPKPIHYNPNPEPEPEPEQGGSVPVVFSGSFGDVIATRTGISGGNVSWSAGDRIMVLWSGGYNYAAASAGGRQAEFSTEVNESERYWAVYPSSLEAAVRSGALSLTVPGQQYGTFDGANIAVASVASGSTGLVFRNLCGLGGFSLTRSDISKIVFRGLLGETLAGDVTVNIGEDGVPSVEQFTSRVDSISVIPASGGCFEAGTYYFAALPGALDAGVSFALSTASGNTIFGKALPAADRLNRAEIRSFGPLDAAGSFTSLTLRFNFGPEAGTKAVSDPDSNWPDAAGDEAQTEGVNYPFSVDGVVYKFYVKDLAGEGKCSWSTNNSNGYADRISIPSTTVFFGLPVIEGYKLTKVVVGQSRRGSSDNAATKITTAGVVSAIPASAGADKDYVAGGELQSWPGWSGTKDKRVVDHVFSLSGTSADTVYYLTSDTAAIGLYFSRLVLTYEK